MHHHDSTDSDDEEHFFHHQMRGGIEDDDEFDTHMEMRHHPDDPRFGMRPHEFGSHMEMRHHPGDSHMAMRHSGFGSNMEMVYHPGDPRFGTGHHTGSPRFGTGHQMGNGGFPMFNTQHEMPNRSPQHVDYFKHHLNPSQKVINQPYHSENVDFSTHFASQPFPQRQTTFNNFNIGDYMTDAEFEAKYGKTDELPTPNFLSSPFHFELTKAEFPTPNGFFNTNVEEMIAKIDDDDVLAKEKKRTSEHQLHQFFDVIPINFQENLPIIEEPLTEVKTLNQLYETPSEDPFQDFHPTSHISFLTDDDIDDINDDDDFTVNDE